jgi:ankyrin repeat protein
MEKKPSAAPPPKYVPSTLAKLGATSGATSRLDAIRAARAAPTATTVAPVAAPKKNMTTELLELVQDCKTSDETLLKILEDVDNPFHIIDDTGSETYTPLSFAIRCNKLAAAEEIIKKIIANMKKQTNAGKTPKEYLQSSALLTPLLEAVRQKNIASIKLLANNLFKHLSKKSLYISPSTLRFIASIFSQALKLKDIDIINELVNSKALPYYKNPYALYDAVKDNYIEAADLIIKTGVNINMVVESGRTPLIMALINKNTDMMRLLLDNGAIIDEVLRDSLTELPRNAPKSNEIITLLQPYIAAQSSLPILPPTNIIATNTSATRPATIFGIHEEDGMPILTIPQGSLLYNSFYVGVLKDPQTGKVNLNTVLKTLGGLTPFATTVEETATGLKVSSCIDKFSQKFFYTNPVGGSALVSVLGSDMFNVTATFQTKRDMRFALLMSPGPFHRLEDMNSKPHPALYQCSESKAEDCECAPLVDNASASTQNRYRLGLGQKCKFGFDYDVCISPEFLHSHKLDGHIAIAGGDSYDDRFKEFQRIFSEMSVAERYKALSNLIFNTCLSVDKRSSTTIRGFPELVIQIFGTDWYSAHSSQRFEYEIPLDTLRVSDEEKVRALVKFLLDFNSQMGPTSTIPIQSPLQLIRIATEYHWYNFETGATKDNSPIANLTVQNKYYRYFMANLEAYFNGDLRFIVDPRTGFLIRPGHLPRVLMSDGTTIPYEGLCFGTASGPSELSISANARINHVSGWDTMFGADASNNMLEYSPSDTPSNINMEGGAQFATRRRPNTVLRRARKTINTVKNKSAVSIVSTKRNTRRNKPKSSTITLDSVYNIYMEEIKRHMYNKNNIKKRKWHTKKNIKMRN